MRSDNARQPDAIENLASLSKPNRPEILPLLSSHCPSLGICGIVVSEKVQSAVYGES